jgi:hypothetical protein
MSGRFRFGFVYRAHNIRQIGNGYYYLVTCIFKPPDPGDDL